MEKIKNSINFINQTEVFDFNLINKSKISKWIEKIIMQNNKEIGEINYVFLSDDDLLNYNIKYLNHNDLTDVITFNYCTKNIISGEILIRIERVTENSKVYNDNQSFKRELNRVMIHGILHLLGFNDKTKEERIIMRKKENKCLEDLKDCKTVD